MPFVWLASPMGERDLLTSTTALLAYHDLTVHSKVFKPIKNLEKTIDGSDGITELSRNWKDYRWQ